MIVWSAVPRVGVGERGRQRGAHGVRGRRVADAAPAPAAARALRAPRALRQARRALREQDHTRRQVRTAGLIPTRRYLSIPKYLLLRIIINPKFT